MHEEKNLKRKYDRFLIALLVICIIAFIVQVYFVSKIHFVADSAHYADTAENLLQGHGFTLDFIDQYFIKFNTVSHQMEWDFPLMSLIVAPFIFFLGKTAFAAKLPTMIIGTILFPILTYYLGKEFFDKRIGFLASVSVLFYEAIFTLSFNGQRDMPFAFFLLAGIYFFYIGLKGDKAKYFYLMGLFLGLSYLIRPSTLIFFPTLFLAYYLIKKRIELKLIYGMLIAALVMSPWLIRNFLVFGDPFFTANYYANWIYGWFPIYEQVGLKIFWGAQKPSLAWILSLPSPEVPVYVKIYYKFAVGFSQQFRQLLTPYVATFIGLLIMKRDGIKRKLTIASVIIILFTIIMQLPFVYNLARPIISDVLFVTFYILPYIAMLLIATFIIAKDDAKVKLFASLWLAFALFHSFYAVPSIRYFLPIIPFLFIFSWAGARRILEIVAEKYKKVNPMHIVKILLALLLIFVLINLPLTFGNFVNKDAVYPYQDHAFVKNKMQVAEMISNFTEKDAVVMSCAASIMRFYTGRKNVEVPSDSLENIVRIMKTYNVSYLSFSWCEKRGIDSRFFNIIFGQETPSNYQNILFRVNLEEITQDQNIIINIKATPVAKIE